MPDQQELRDAGRLTACPHCRATIPELHAGAFCIRRGPRRWAWKVASYCLVCETFYITRCQAPAPGRPGGRTRVHLLGPAAGPEADIARSAIFGRAGVDAPAQDGVAS